MKMSEKWKRFRNLTARHDGFTLVELIVVIAILAILAGVAIPAYSGYIKKANEAADQQLLAAVNTAFAAACAENGLNPAQLNVNPALVYKTGTKAVAGVSVEELNGSFVNYYAGNQNTEFKKMVKIVFHSQLGMFVDAASFSGTIPMNYGGGTLYLNADDIAKLGDSAFITGVGVETLMDKVMAVTGMAAGMVTENIDGNFAQLIYGQEYMAYLATNLGLTASNPMTEAESNALNDKLDQMAFEALKAKNPSLTWDEFYGSEAHYTQLDQMTMTNAVLYAAKNTTNKDELMSIFASTEKTPVEVIKEKMNSGEANDAYALGQMSAIYGMYTSYIQYLKANNLRPETVKEFEESDITTLLSGLTNSDQSEGSFYAYLQTEQASKDLDGYIASMNMMNSSSTDPNAVEELLKNGFTDQEIIDILKQSTGGGN